MTRPPSLRSFVADYQRVRLREGYASADPEYARRLPSATSPAATPPPGGSRALHYLIIRAGLGLVRAHAADGVPRAGSRGRQRLDARRLAPAFRVTALDVDGTETGLGSLRDGASRASSAISRRCRCARKLRRRHRGGDACITRSTSRVRWPSPRACSARRSADRRRLAVLRRRGRARGRAGSERARHYADFDAAHLAAATAGCRRAELDAPGLFRFVTVTRS
jgi:hypothetical protein